MAIHHTSTTRLLVISKEQDLFLKNLSEEESKKQNKHVSVCSLVREALYKQYGGKK